MSPIGTHGFPIDTTCKLWPYLLPFARYLTSKSVFFDAPLSQVFEKTGRFWTVTMTFSERYNSLDVIAVKIFQKSLIVSSQRAKTWRPGRKFDRNFDVFWPLWPGFWTFQKSPSSFFAQSRDTHSWQIWCKSVERRLRNFGGRKKSKPTEKHNITEILKNCIFAKTEI